MDITRTWAPIDLERMQRNNDAIRACLKDGMEIDELVSANAYSFSPAVGGPMQGKCPPFLTVRTVEEGCVLRQRGCTLPILVREYPCPDNVTLFVKTLHRNFLALRVDNLDEFRALSARVIPIFGGLLAIHIDVAIGEEPGVFSYAGHNGPIDDLVLVKSTLGLYCQGICTHLDASLPEEEKMEKVKALHEAADRLEEISGKLFAIRHVFCR